MERKDVDASFSICSTGSIGANMDLLKQHWRDRRSYLRGMLKGVDASLDRIVDGPGMEIVRDAVLAERDRITTKILELDELIGPEVPRVWPVPEG